LTQHKVPPKITAEDGLFALQERIVTSQLGSAPPLEIAHVLFMDVVAYSSLQMDQQQKAAWPCGLQELP